MKAYRGSSLAFGLVCCIAFCVFAQEKQEGEQKLARKIRETVEKIPRSAYETAATAKRISKANR